jgi:Protein of unknown function (DUF1549)/Bacterial Ig-like domain (group 2)
MTKVGCNCGACHGAAGKNGFKLTLRGYDPDADYYTLARQSIGRRISLSAPSHSLMLLKPTLAVLHGGGQRFSTDAQEYRVISQWIAAGAPRPTDKDPQVTGLEVFPASAVLKPGAEQQIVVRARYSDGRLRDVTRWVKFSSTDDGVATVDPNGRVKTNGSDEAAITLYYGRRVLYARLGVPCANKVDPAGDATFLGPAYLDAAGILPTSEEVQDFLADKSPGKRARLVDRLLQRDEFVDHRTYKWSDPLLVSRRKLPPPAMWSFYDWIRDSVKHNKPCNKFTCEIFTSSGDTRRNGALNYYVLHKRPIDRTETATQAFMGNRITCARCHNHPLENRAISWSTPRPPGTSFIRACASPCRRRPSMARPCRSIPPKTATCISPAGSSLPKTSTSRARWSIACGPISWAAAWSNPWITVGATNPASNEERFAALSGDFVKSGYDVQRLIRTIMNSGTYQLSADTNAANSMDTKYYYPALAVKPGWSDSTVFDHESTGATVSIQPPVTLNGKLLAAKNDFRFHACKGEMRAFETNAGRLGSKPDSLLELLDAQGARVERATIRCVLQTAVRRSVRDSVSSGVRVAAPTGFAVGDMVLFGSQLIQVAAIPCGPDDDMRFTSFDGQRLGFLGTTPEAHAIDTPVYKARIYPPRAAFVSNGLPLVHLRYRNDDGGPGYGKDSHLRFTAPADGDYIVRLRDVRGLHGADYPCRRTVRPPLPGLPFRCRAGGPIDIAAESLPPGFLATSGMIPPGRASAAILLSADPHARRDRVVPLKVSGFMHWAAPEDTLSLLSLTPPPDITMEARTREVVLQPGKTAQVEVAIQRHNHFGGRVPVAVYNLPPTVIVTDVGLNGVLIHENSDHVTFTLQALPNARPMEQPMVISGNIETRADEQSDYAAEPVILKVVAKK